MSKFLFSALVLFVMMQMHSQQKTISGTVSDSGGPLPGVGVIIKGTTIGTETDFDGAYSIKTNLGDVLQFSFVGMETVESTVGALNIKNITMVASAEALNEVIITALGIKRQPKSLGYSVQSISSEQISGVYVRGNSSIQGYGDVNNESYEGITENTFKYSQLSPLSTFSIDVDKASYSNIRRMINNGQKVPADAVKIEEMINYFDYKYTQPTDEHPFSIQTEYSSCAWNKDHKLVKIGLQGKEVPMDKIPPSNLVFLLDVSGSMNSTNKLPLLKSAFKLLVNQLREQDKVSIVVYAGAAGLVLEPTSGANKQKILESLNNLQAGGSTAGGAGIELAYKIAQENFIDGGNNRVILATDGDFNVGASSNKSMEELIVEKRKSGVFLTALGFGMGNYKDSKLEILADKGNGNHAYIDTMQEAQKVLGKEFGGTLYTIAKDVKIQVEFNPTKVAAYRLIGYENRLLADEDFIDDTKDAGELGSGHSVTALYEIILVGVKSKFLKDVDGLKYTKTTSTNSFSDELLTVKFRYKKPDGNTSKEIVYPLVEEEIAFSDTSDDFKFVSAVSLFGMKIRKSKFSKKSNFDDVISLAENGRGTDKEGYRAEFIRMVKAYK